MEIKNRVKGDLISDFIVLKPGPKYHILPLVVAREPAAPKWNLMKAHE